MHTDILNGASASSTSLYQPSVAAARYCAHSLPCFRPLSATGLSLGSTCLEMTNALGGCRSEYQADRRSVTHGKAPVAIGWQRRCPSAQVMKQLLLCRYDLPRSNARSNINNGIMRQLGCVQVDIAGKTANRRRRCGIATHRMSHGRDANKCRRTHGLALASDTAAPHARASPCRACVHTRSTLIESFTFKNRGNNASCLRAQSSNM